MLSRWMAASLYKKEIKELRASLSMRTASPELLTYALRYIGPGRVIREPYREILKGLEQRLQATIDWTEEHLLPTKSKPITPSTDHQYKPIKTTIELMEPLQCIYTSLHTTGNEVIANASLLDTIRQESHRHSEALDSITKHLGLGSYLQWDENTRRNWLIQELSSKRPLLHRVTGSTGSSNNSSKTYEQYHFSQTVIDTLRTFDTIATLGEESLGAYVISQCQQASDILAVVLLQQEALGTKGQGQGGATGAGAGGKVGASLLQVVPLFETLDDLQRASETIDALFAIPVYRGIISGKQEIMVGYSDSAKDAGRLAAAWAQYKSQLAMMDVAQKYQIELTFFHGKGGTVGRGGNPALFQAILAHPPGTINGRFRVTEQGEMITQNFGQIPVAERTLDLFTAGVLAERFIPRPLVKTEWQEMMERLSEASCEVYRHIVREEPRFVPYFRTATPELELAGLNVGSRPSKRNPKGGVESLRAIPWNFAWTQTRLNLPTWLGVGEALAKEQKEHPEVLQDMVQHWPWFSTLIDLLEMILVKSEMKIAENYNVQLVKEKDSVALGKELRGKMAQTIESVLQVSGNESLQAHNHVLLRSLEVRNPYVDPLNIIQAEVLKRLRAVEDGTLKLSEEEVKIIQDSLLVTINGVANGMRNSG